MKYILYIVLISLIMLSCRKDDFPPQDDMYFQMRVNGKVRAFAMCGLLFGGTGGGQFECTVVRDTVLFIVAGCGGKGLFSVNNALSDGTYILNGHNIASVSVGESSYNYYRTDSLHTGSLSIEKIRFRNQNCLRGKFFYTGIDTSGNVGIITEGSFLMPRSYF